MSFGSRIVLKDDNPLDADHAASITFPAASMHDRSSLRLTLAISKGTAGTLDVALEQSEDGVTWRSLAAFAQASGVGSERKCFGPCDRHVRAKATIAGGGAWRFTVTGDSI